MALTGQEWVPAVQAWTERGKLTVGKGGYGKRGTGGAVGRSCLGSGKKTRVWRVTSGWKVVCSVKVKRRGSRARTGIGTAPRPAVSCCGEGVNGLGGSSGWVTRQKSGISGNAGVCELGGGGLFGFQKLDRKQTV